ncbi:hypothetical protein B0T10DRAFT_453807 [Thelonectria olida]|uniref:Uncharacterized protein n=1 Tax=Thelonectria olida TaxID=1576542 RepID=A0A9P8WE11_9HYPO|nr:hypothetical protein B0T10DRAFT_453807 [Thelonectria olida]
MSLSRAFTTRKARLANDLSDFNNKSPQRSNSARHHPNPQMLRNKISAPIQLVHTTNMLSYNAPDLPKHVLRNKASTRSEDSETPSETHSETPSVAETTPPTSPEVSPVEECPGPEPNHLSTYFMIPGKAHPLAKLSEAPAIPKRSPSHTKQNSYDAIARNRSVSRMSKDSDRSVSTKASFTFSRSSSTSTSASSTASMSPAQKEKPASPAPPVPSPPAFHQQRAFKEPHQSHPFGQELAQVTELAEEYSASTRATNSQDDEDNMYIKAKGLVKFTADDYLNDVQSLLTSFFPDMTHAKPSAPLWI